MLAPTHIVASQMETGTQASGRREFGDRYGSFGAAGEVMPVGNALNCPAHSVIFVLDLVVVL
jgi:hypothetical protein